MFDPRDRSQQVALYLFTPHQHSIAVLSLLMQKKWLIFAQNVIYSHNCLSIILCWICKSSNNKQEAALFGVMFILNTLPPTGGPNEDAH